MRLFAYQNFLILFLNKFSELSLTKISMEVPKDLKLIFCAIRRVKVPIIV